MSDEAELRDPNHQARAPIAPSIHLQNKDGEWGCTEQQVVQEEEDRKAKEEADRKAEEEKARKAKEEAERKEKEKEGCLYSQCGSNSLKRVRNQMSEERYWHRFFRGRPGSSRIRSTP